MTYKTILFDLDGTLLNTNELIISSFLHTFEHFCPEKGYVREDIIAHLGLPLRDAFACFQHGGQIEEMMEMYREHNIRMHDEMVTAFEHVPEVVRELNQQGIKLGIVTTKQRNTVEMGLKLAGLDIYMQAVVTIQDVQQAKPHPEPVLKAMRLLEADKKSTLMVGDSRYDIEAAQQAGIDSAGVSWSIKGEDYLRSFSPTYILKDMRALLSLVEEGQ